MRKTLLLLAVIVLPFFSSAQVIISEDFESYTAGQLLAANSDLWTTWSGGVDAEDAYVSNNYASSGSNSVVIQGYNGPTDLILPFPEDYTEGVFTFELKMYLTSNHGGYWNIQSSSTPGEDWMFEIYLDDGGGGYISAGGTASASVTYTPNAWNDVKVWVDLDNDLAECYVNSSLIHSWTWSDGANGGGATKSLGGIDIFSYSADGSSSDMYIDDVVLTKIVPAQPGLLWDDFESYTAGVLLASQSDLWTTWSGGIDGEDALVSNSYAVTGTQSFNVVGTIGPTDLILPFPEDYTSGVYEFSCKMYVVSGKGGYWNIQQSATPGLGWMFEIYLDDDGTGYIYTGGDNTNITYTPDTWMSLNVWVDLDNDLARFYQNSHLIHEWQWSLGADGSGAEKSLGGIDFFAYAANGAACNYYIDNVLLQQHTTEGVFVDDFEDFVPGTLLAANSDIWTTWSGGVDAEDAPVDGLIAYDGFNSFNVEGTIGPTDLILPFAEDYSTGVYDLSWKMYVASGYGGYFNIQQSSTPGVGFMFELYFDNDGTGYINAGGSNAAQVTYTPDAWMDIKFHIDLTNDQAEFYVDGNLIHSWQWSLGSDGGGAGNMLGGIDFFAYAAGGAACNYYVDNLVLAEAIGTATPEVNQFNPGVFIYPNPSDGQFTVKLSGLKSGKYQIQVADMLGKIISNETLNLSGSSSKDFNLKVSSGVYHLLISDGSQTKSQKIVVN